MLLFTPVIGNCNNNKYNQKLALRLLMPQYVYFGNAFKMYS